MSRETIKSIERLLSQDFKLTPMIEQYYQIKQKNPEILLFFRMGDFYELFFNDAVEVSKLLNITLTHRGKIGTEPIPMAGIPHHAANSYLDRLTSMGLKVAICEQTEDPKNAVGIVKRDITQIVSPSMPFDLDKADITDHHFMACGNYYKGKFQLVFIDFTSGTFLGDQFSSSEELIEKVSKLRPKEFITFRGQWERFSDISKFLEKSEMLKTYLLPEYFEQKNSEHYIEKLIPFYKKDKILNSCIEILNPLGALSYLIASTQPIDSLIHLKPFRMAHDRDILRVTLPTLEGLEILPSSKEKYKESLLGFFDKTKTSMGTRYLKQFFLNPISQLAIIEQRQKIIGYFTVEADILSEIRQTLSNTRDIERIMAKLSAKKASSGDLLNIANTIIPLSSIRGSISKIPTKILPQISDTEFIILEGISKKILMALNSEIGASLEKGNLINPGFNKKRDELFFIEETSKLKLEKIEKKYKSLTGISKIKIKSNNIFGYFIEIPKTQASKIPDYFERKQTLVNCERFTTSELIRFETEILSAKENLLKLERKIYQDLIEEVTSCASQLQKIAALIGSLDVFQSLAFVALQEDLKAPKIVPGKNLLNVKGAWHPLVKSLISEKFITHDLFLNEDSYFGLLTGPNMAGKTTVMREMGIIQFLAQIGSFVPAKSAELGLCDYLFSRLGACDDILKGQSTFMVEMSETSEIIRHSSKNSFIILDEVGRGTSTYDGLSIAWALVEHLIRKTKAITLFATHYHELIEVVEGEKGGKNLTVETVVEKGDVRFLYKLIESGAAQSYGIYVAKLAGLPRPLLKRAEEILYSLEKECIKNGKSQKNSPTQLFLFEDSDLTPRIPQYLKDLEGEIAKIDPLRITPLEALQTLHNLRENIPTQ